MTVKVKGFQPYFYVKVPQQWTQADADALQEKLLTDRVEMRKSNGETYMSTVIRYAVRDHLDDPDAGLRALAKVLKPGGLIGIGLYSAAARTQLDTIRRWRDAGRVTVAQYANVYAAWNGTSSLYRRSEDNVGFSLNWQDFSYPANSASELRTLLNAHEAAGVPVDVFFTTWQTDVIETQAPELIGRLRTAGVHTVLLPARSPGATP